MEAGEELEPEITLEAACKLRAELEPEAETVLTAACDVDTEAVCELKPTPELAVAFVLVNARSDERSEATTETIADDAEGTVDACLSDFDAGPFSRLEASVLDNARSDASADDAEPDVGGGPIGNSEISRDAETDKRTSSEVDTDEAWLKDSTLGASPDSIVLDDA